MIVKLTGNLARYDERKTQNGARIIKDITITQYDLKGMTFSRFTLFDDDLLNESYLNKDITLEIEMYPYADYSYRIKQLTPMVQ